MKTISTIIDQCTNPDILYNDLLKTLRETDPSFAVEEAQFSAAVFCLKENLSKVEANNLDTYLSAAREEIAAIMVYTGWLGFQLNLDCWKQPIHQLVLEQDHEEITRERIFDSIPAIKQARTTKETAYKAIPEIYTGMLLDISDFFSYLHTAAPKLAHLAGFQCADVLLNCVIPGYTPDTILTRIYTRSVEEYLHLNLSIA